MRPRAQLVTKAHSKDFHIYKYICLFSTMVKNENYALYLDDFYFFLFIFEPSVVVNLITVIICFLSVCRCLYAHRGHAHVQNLCSYCFLGAFFVHLWATICLLRYGQLRSIAIKRGCIRMGCIRIFHTT